MHNAHYKLKADAVGEYIWVLVACILQIRKQESEGIGYRIKLHGFLLIEQGYS